MKISWVRDNDVLDVIDKIINNATNSINLKTFDNLSETKRFFVFIFYFFDGTFVFFDFHATKHEKKIELVLIYLL